MIACSKGKSKPLTLAFVSCGGCRSEASSFLTPYPIDSLIFDRAGKLSFTVDRNGCTRVSYPFPFVLQILFRTRYISEMIYGSFRTEDLYCRNEPDAGAWKQLIIINIRAERVIHVIKPVVNILRDRDSIVDTVV